MPIAKVQLQDGRIAKFEVPEGTTQEQVMEQVNAQFGDGNINPRVQENQPQNFLQRVGSDLTNRAGEFNTSLQAYGAGQQSAPETALQIFGKAGIGTLGDIAGNALISGARELPESWQQAGTQIIGDVMGSRPVQSALQAYNQFQQESPRAARNVESIANIAGFLGTPAAAVTGKAVEGASSLVGKATTLAKEALKKRKINFVQDLVLEPETPKRLEEMALNSTEKGLLKTRVYTPSDQETLMVTDVAELGVSKGKTNLANLNVIKSAIEKEARGLEKTLEKSTAKILEEDLVNALSKTRNELEENIFLTGDGKKSAEKLTNTALQFVMDNGLTPSGVLKSRKQLDALVKKQKGGKFFGSETENAIQAAVLSVRRTLNDVVANAVDNVDVKRSLSKQSNYLTAMQNIAPKIAKEGKDRLSRFRDKLPNTPLTRAKK
jgi:hypothetical protein